MTIKNTLFDSNIGDVTSINIPIGQTQAYPGAFTALVASQVSVSGSVGILQSVNGAVAPGSTALIASAVLITAAVNFVTTGALVSTTGASMILPSAGTWVGGLIVVGNANASACVMFPAVGDRIDVTVSGAFVVIDAGKRAEFWSVAGSSGAVLGQIMSMAAVTSV